MLLKALVVFYLNLYVPVCSQNDVIALLCLSISSAGTNLDSWPLKEENTEPKEPPYCIYCSLTMSITPNISIFHLQKEMSFKTQDTSNK